MRPNPGHGESVSGAQRVRISTGTIVDAVIIAAARWNRIALDPRNAR